MSNLVNKKDIHNKLRLNQSGKLSVMYFKTEIIITYDTSLLNK